MDNITPSGYIYGRDPKQTNPFWDINKVDEKTLQDMRWLGVEDFPENYSVTIDINKVSNKINYTTEVSHALYQKEIDYLTIENSKTDATYITPYNSGKVFTFRNSKIYYRNYLFTNNSGYHKAIFDNCDAGGESYLSLFRLSEAARHSRIVEFNNVAMNSGSTSPTRIDGYSVNFPFLSDSCLILKWNKNSNIYTLYSDSSASSIKYTKLTIFIEDEKIPKYLANSRWATLVDKIRPLSEFHEEDW